MGRGTLSFEAVLAANRRIGRSGSVFVRLRRDKDSPYFFAGGLWFFGKLCVRGFAVYK